MGVVEEKRLDVWEDLFALDLAAFSRQEDTWMTPARDCATGVPSLHGYVLQLLKALPILLLGPSLRKGRQGQKECGQSVIVDSVKGSHLARVADRAHLGRIGVHSVHDSETETKRCLQDDSGAESDEQQHPEPPAK